jgi:RNA polymerase sigma factor (sigma-70 family)
MSEVTSILSQIEHGDPQAAEKLLPLVYAELRKLAAAKLAQEKPGQTLQATALVHEAYLKLVGGSKEIGDGEQRGDAGDHNSEVTNQDSGDQQLLPQSCPLSSVSFDSRGHFFASAAEAMRRILVDQARRRETMKRGGGLHRHDLDEVQIAAPEPNIDLLALDDALGRFHLLDPRKAELVRLRYFAGLTLPQAAEVMGISTTTADRYWAYARAWLHTELGREA